MTISRQHKSTLLQTLNSLLWYPGFEADVLQLAAANPSNEFPVLLRGVQTRNVVVLQCIVGKIHGLHYLSAAFKELETASAAFQRYVTHEVCMIKGIGFGPIAGSRPAHTFDYDFPEGGSESLCIRRGCEVSNLPLS